MNKVNKIVLFGLGSIGQRYVSLLRQHYPQYQLSAFRRQCIPYQDLTVIDNWKDLERVKPQIAVITNPTNLHLETALQCAKRNMHLLIEKPLSHSLEQVEKLQLEVKNRKLITYVGYCLRFHPAIKWLKEYLNSNRPLHVRVVCSSYLPSWRNDGLLDVKNHYRSYHSKGGGVTLELSHELDYLTYLFGPLKQGKGYCAKKSNLTVDAEDYADYVLQFKDVPCNLHLNFFSRENRREINLDFSDQFIRVDLLKGMVTTLINDHEKISEQVISLKVDRDAILLEQLNYFLTAIESNSPTMNNLQEASLILQNILRLKQEAWCS